MPKKNKKNKGGGEKVRKKCVNERETVSYEQQILDYNKQLSRFVCKRKKSITIPCENSLHFSLRGLILVCIIFRLRSRNEELENEMKVITKKFDQLQEDRSDVVAHLKRNLEEKMEEARELNERLSALEELRKQELAECKEKEKEMELEYRTMENTLTAEVKLTGNYVANIVEVCGRKIATFFLAYPYPTEEFAFFFLFVILRRYIFSLDTGCYVKFIKIKVACLSSTDCTSMIIEV